MSAPHPKLTKSVLTTLAYSAHFGFPLTLDEIHLRLIGIKISHTSLVRQIRLLLIQGVLAQTNGYYHLPGSKSLVARRLRCAKLSVPQLTRAKSLALRLSRVPGILALYLTGSLAMHNSDANSDIDLMVITRRGRLWTTRLLLTLSTSLLGLRRTPGSTHPTGKLCLNLYLTPANYQLPTTKRSLYTAYELIQAAPLYDPHNTQSDLLAANPWIRSYLPNTSAPPRSDLEGRAQPERSEGRSDLLGIIESLCYHLQLLYMRPKITREYITPDSAFFHPHNPAPRV